MYTYTCPRFWLMQCVYGIIQPLSTDVATLFHRPKSLLLLQVNCWLYLKPVLTHQLAPHPTRPLFKPSRAQQVHRQRDSDFVDVLHRCRLGTCTEEDIAYIQRSAFHSLHTGSIRATRLCTHVKQAEVSHSAGRVRDRAHASELGKERLAKESKERS